MADQTDADHINVFYKICKMDRAIAPGIPNAADVQKVKRLSGKINPAAPNNSFIPMKLHTPEILPNRALLNGCFCFA